MGLMAHNWFKHSETSNILCKGIDKKERKVEIEEMIENDEGLWKCKRCGKTASQKSYLKHHVVTHIEATSVRCSLRIILLWYLWEVKHEQGRLQNASTKESSARLLICVRNS